MVILAHSLEDFENQVGTASVKTCTSEDLGRKCVTGVS